MSTNLNRDTVQRWIDDVISAKSPVTAEEVIAADYVNHMTGLPFPVRGPAGENQLCAAFKRGCPDATFDVEQIVAEGDRVAIRSVYSGTHTGELMGLPPTGKRFSMGAHNVLRLRDGKIVENWPVLDMAGLMQQLGALPGAP